MTPRASGSFLAPLAWRWHTVAIGVLLLVTLLVVHAEAVRGMLRLWNDSPMYSYGYLVPLISAFLAWSRRGELARTDMHPSFGAGLALLALWLALYAAGRFAAVLLAEQVALVVGVAGAIALVWGWRTLRIVWAAVAFLLLMVPLWDGFTESLHVPFQNLSANIGVRMLDLVGVPAYREGTFITLPNLTLEVARACSGVNYLVAVLALGLPLGYLYLRSPWRRVVLLVSALLVAALSNSLRVALIGVLVYFDLGAPLHGPGHVLHGLFVSAMGHVVLFGGLAILRRGERADESQAPSGTAPVVGSPSAGLRLAPVLVALAAFWVAAGLMKWREPRPVALIGALDRLPATLGPWTADPYAAPSALPWWTGAETELRRTYRRGDRAVDVHLNYFPSQRQSHEVVTHRASELHRAARAFDVRLDSANPTAVNLATETQDGPARLDAFWYELDGVVETTPADVKLRTLWNAVGRGRTNGAVICLRTADPGPAGRDAVLDELGRLAGDVHRGLAASLPGRSPALAAAVPPGVAR